MANMTTRYNVLVKQMHDYNKYVVEFVATEKNRHQAECAALKQTIKELQAGGQAHRVETQLKATQEALVRAGVENLRLIRLVKNQTM